MNKLNLNASDNTGTLAAGVDSLGSDEHQLQ
jgi:hypothetical protein